MTCHKKLIIGISFFYSKPPALHKHFEFNIITFIRQKQKSKKNYL